MPDLDYWQKQSKRRLFEEVDCLRPEQKRLAGKMLFVGGHKGAFFAIATAMKEAEAMGLAGGRAVLPDSLRTTIPATPELVFVPAEASGGFGQDALAGLLEQANWADAVVLVGDFGKNTETAKVMTEFLNRLDAEKAVFVMRDGVDTVLGGVQDWAMRTGETMVFATMAQLQKLLRALYYPKMINLSMPMNQLVETLHKLTLSYGLTVMTVHQNQLVVAQGGEVVSMDLGDTSYTLLSLFSGALMVRMATLGLWNPGVKLMKCVAVAWTLA